MTAPVFLQTREISQPALEYRPSKTEKVAEVVGAIAMSVLIAFTSFVFLPWELAIAVSTSSAGFLFVCVLGSERKSSAYYRSFDVPLPSPPMPIVLEPLPWHRRVSPFSRRETIAVADPRQREIVGGANLFYRKKEPRIIHSEVRPAIAPPRFAIREPVGRRNAAPRAAFTPSNEELRQAAAHRRANINQAPVFFGPRVPVGNR